MPIYVYEKKGGKGCPHCRTGFEINQRLNEPKIERCPECGGEVMRVICAPALGHSKTDLHYRAKRAGFKCLQKVQKGEYETVY